MVHAPDTSNGQPADTLKNIKLFSKKRIDITTTTVPVQQLDRNELSKLNSLTVADALKYLPGIVVKDYGGIGGLKTVSVRSLGSNHTGVMYDGVMLGDAQGGQIDLGRFSLDNVESIQLFNNQPADVLLPARSYASASVIALSSGGMRNAESPGTELLIKMKTGSFEFINPSIYYTNRSGKNFSTGINAEYQSAKGNYPFVDYETGLAKSRRSNSDIRTYRVEYDAAYALNDSNKIKFKAYYHDSKRGLPGAVILYNDFSDQRLDNSSFFSQLSWQKDFSSKSRLIINSKYSADHKYYIDPSYQNSAGKLENDFYQKEFYLSAAAAYKIIPSLSLSYAVDYFINTLKRTDGFAQDFANPDRNNLLNNLSLKWKMNRFEINGNLLHSYITEKVEHGATANDLHELTPSFSAALQPIANFPLRLRASYKKIFRAPSFDDLYYTNVGNTNLRPEYADLYNIGFTIKSEPKITVEELILTSDFYYNRVKDKILAVPRQNLFQWTTLNIGRAETRGIDFSAHIRFKKYRALQISASLSYSYQQALDISDATAALYKTQLPYTPIHSGSTSLMFEFKSLSFAYNILSSAYRYRLGDPGPENVVQGWSTHDVSISYSLASKKKSQFKIIAEANNIYNVQYEIIKYYPMPRFNYRVGITASFRS